MATEPKAHFTPEEYLAYERRNEFKSEYVGGEIVAMTGASRRHNLIAGNLFAILHTLLKRNRNCEVYSMTCGSESHLPTCTPILM
jgi:Uma2 family endonuclease